MKDLYDTILMTNPSIHSIGIYNKEQDEFYSVASKGRLDTEQFKQTILKESYQPVLQPVLNQVTTILPTTTTQDYVLTYFIYQAPSSGQQAENCVVINQYVTHALWVFNLDTIENDTVTYMLNNSQTVANKPLAGQDQEIHTELLNRFKERIKTLSSDGTYTDSVQNKQYLISYLFPEKNDTVLLTIQPYDIVFSDVIQLRIDFLIIFSIMTVISVLSILFFSRKLYSPVEKTLNYFAQNTALPRGDLNELEYIQHVYENTNVKLQNLSMKTRLYTPMALRYNLYTLLLQSDTQNIAHFQKTLPNHWLSSYTGVLRIILIKPIVLTAENQSSPDNLLLYATQNIAEELLGEQYQCASFRHAGESLGIVIGCREEEDSIDYATLYSIIEKIRTSMDVHFSQPTAVAISDTNSNLLDLSKQFQDTLHLLSYAFLFGPCILTKELCAHNEENEQTTYGADFDRKLKEAIYAKDLSRIRTIMDEIEIKLSAMNSNYAITCMGMLFVNLHRCVLQNTQQDAMNIIMQFNNSYQRVMNAPYLKISFNEMMQYLEKCIMSSENAISATDTHFTASVIEFIQKEYTNSALCSQMIADNLGINNRYLMQKFKSLTGHTLNDYIVNFRIKNAAHLLKTSQFSVNEIAQHVGIDNVSYFYKLFKKVYGCTPREFAEIDSTQ